MTQESSNPSIQSPELANYSSTMPGTTAPLPTTAMTTARAMRRSKGGGAGVVGVAGERNRRSAADRVVQVRSRGAMTAPLTAEELREKTLMEDAVCKAAGGLTKRQLHEATTLELIVDTSRYTVEGVWDAAPKLHTLTLDGSHLLSFRDLGVGLRHLNTLFLESSGVEDLDGIGALSGLRELHLAHNRISDVTPLACHGSLQVLGLRQNRVSDMNTLEILRSLPLLYSLNLSQNPLMEALGKLRDGKGRRVVRQLIPQIRILDGTHLSLGEDSAVDAQTLEEADDLICQGACRARAAWAEEDQTVSVALAAAPNATVRIGGEEQQLLQQQQQQQHERQQQDEIFWADSNDSSVDQGRKGAERAVHAAAEGGFGGYTSPPPSHPNNGGTMHWDSDLTQGGRPALSGNPSSAIRRHKSRAGGGAGREGHSPTRVLETLDLAKVMEMRLKQRRHSQQSAETVSEWRRETCSDSMPPEDLNFAPLDPAVSPKKGERLERQDTPTAYSLSTRKSGFSRYAGKSAGEGSATPAPLKASVDTSGVVAEVKDALRYLLLNRNEGRLNSSGRPWTTGGVVGGNRPQALAAAAAESSDCGGVESDQHQRQSCPQGRGAAGGERGEGGGCRSEGQGVRSFPRRRRPQTAKELGKRGALPGPDHSGAFQTNSSASWQSVWESLRIARLISSPRVAQTETVLAEKAEGETTVGNRVRESSGVVERRIRGVDFGRQRRARTTAKAGRGGGKKCCYDSDSACSAIEEETGSSKSSDGGDSQEAGGRTFIKKRSSGFSSGNKKWASGVGGPSSLSPHSCAAAATVSRSPPSPPGPGKAAAAVSTASLDDTGQTCVQASLHQVGNSTDNRGVLPRKGRRRETTRSVTRRSLGVMDDDTDTSDSSEGEESSRRGWSTQVGRGGRTEQGLRDQGGKCTGAGLRSGGGQCSAFVDHGREQSGVAWVGEGSSSSPSRVSSVHASRMLGFDLRKSLAAIDEWTDKATTTATKGGDSSDTPRRVSVLPEAGHNHAPFVIQHSTVASGLSPAFTPVGAWPCTANAGPEVERASPARGKIVAGGDAAARRQPPTISQKSRSRHSTSSNIQANRGVDRNRGGDDEGDGDDDEEEVLSIAAARAALGISKVVNAAPASCKKSGAQGALSPAEVNAVATQAGLRSHAGGTAVMKTLSGNRRKGSKSSDCSSKGRNEGSSVRRAAMTPETAVAATPTRAVTGLAVGLSDEKLKGMLKRQPRTVPELRTKESFREFFQGMEAERMNRLLRGAYEGSLPADQVDRKVKKRLGLVGDMLAW